MLLAIFTDLKRLGLVANHAAFSLDYLNKGPRYFDDLRCSDWQPSVSALVSLSVRLRAIADTCGHGVVMEHREGELRAMAGVVWLEIEERSCALLTAKQRRRAPVRGLQRVIGDGATRIV